MRFQILETDQAFFFINYEEFDNLVETPYISLAKKESVEDIGVVEFNLQDFVNLLDLSWKTDAREEEVEVIQVGAALDYRHAMTSVLIWEERRVNCKGDGRKGLWCLLTMNCLKKEIYDRLRKNSSAILEVENNA